SLIIPDGVSEPNDVCIPRTNVAESADVMKNDDTSSIATSDRSSPIGSSLKTPNSCGSAGISKISGTLWPTDTPDMPKVLNQTMTISAGTNSTARTNSRLVRPRATRAMNMPTNGLQLIHLPQ